ncbi:MAG: PAS domain S-box protein [Leptospiraceae bacterium]|nr:PAS domain S-box protein [Leptospiraceae bacterium]
MEKDFLHQDYIVEYIQFLESILQTASFGIWKWDAKRQELLLTKDLYEILNVEADTYRLNLENYRRIIHPEDLELVWENLQKTLRGQSQDYYDKYRIVNKNNQVLWIEVKGKVVRNRRGRAIFIFGVATNITERVLSEQAYESQSILLQEAGKISKMGAWEIDVDTNSIFWTSETYKIFEVPETQAIDIDTFLEVFEDTDQFIIKKKIDKSIFEGVPFDEECPIFVNNKRKWIRIIGIPQKERNRFIKIIGTVQDITQNKQIQQSLVESEERFQIFYDLASEGICIFNKDFKIIDTNPAFSLLFDLDSSNLINSNLGNYFTQDSFTVLKKYIESGDSFEEQIFLEGVRKDGEKIPFQCKFRTIY